ncbi:MAG: IPT/TIG domain-containing protein [Acidobacteriota bacterium]
MRRFQFPNAALLAGLAVLLSGCSGETPTAPGPVTPPGQGTPGSCTTLISLSATTDNPFAGSGSIVRATVTKNGIPVADGGSVQFSTTLGTFAENGLNAISKTTSGGVADVTVLSTNNGTAQVVAVYECARAQKNLQVQGVPDTGPVITSYTPTNGTCAGGDIVTINGVRLGNGTGVKVFFGGIEGSVTQSANTQIRVLTPARTLKNPTVPESVPVVVVVNGVSSPAAAVLFTYACIPDALKMSVSSITPTAGSPAGGDLVQILGRNFGTTIATTQVTFCGRSAQIVGLQDQLITVSSPTHILANPAVSEACDVVVTRDIGLVSQQSATAPRPFTYTGNGSGGVCNTDPTFFIASLTPTSGSPDGGTTVTLTGSGFGSNASLLRVDFGGTPATITNVSNTTIVVSTPRRALSSPNVPETVDVTVTDLGSQAQRCARVVSGFVYTALALDPVIYSSSPKTGPNDTSTRVSIFGTGFQFPMQVFLTGGTCGAQRVEAQVSDISLNTIVFKTPVAEAGNVCLANQLVDIVILNPSTGKTASCPACFKYYSCPTITSIAPGFGSYLGGTQVVITGHNFEDPATVGGGGTAWSPISVSSQQIIAVTAPLLVTGCADVAAAVLVNGTALSCPNAVGPIFTYYVKSASPFVTSVVPSVVNQGGGEVVTINGGNFIDPNMRVVLKLPSGAPVSIFPTTRTATQITFVTPPFRGAFAAEACTTSGGAAGTRNADTVIEMDVVNQTTTCSAIDQLTYHPSDITCRTGPLTITTTTLPNGIVATAYSQTVTASGGTGSYSFSLASGTLPAGLSLSASGTISGTPTASGTSTFTVSVSDGATSATKILSITIP